MYISTYLPQLLFTFTYATTLCLGRSTPGYAGLSGISHSTSTYSLKPAIDNDFNDELRTSVPQSPRLTSEDVPPKDVTVCNGYAELCQRRYSNVTVVGTHNSPFVRRNSLAANQELEVHDQLDDGVRFLQAQMHWPWDDGEPHFCHTSCHLLDAGPITQWLGHVKEWVEIHPHDVVTILFGNGNYSLPSRYAPYIESTGLVEFAYIPPKKSMGLQDWPTLEQMIQSGKRVVMMLDYNADEAAYPWLISEFNYMWETPFDPLFGSGLPCSIQRPPNLADSRAKDSLYLLNHNVNIEVTLAGQSFLIPAVSIANQSNAASGEFSLGESAERCRQDWTRPPTVLNVDYYNHGQPPGSVFQVAATMNGVTYNRTCCGKTVRSGARRVSVVTPVAMMLVVAAMFPHLGV